MFNNDFAHSHKSENHHETDAYFTGLHWGGGLLGVDIGLEPDSYVFQFCDRTDKNGAKGLAKQILERMGCVHDYQYRNGQFIKPFQFPAGQNELIEHIKTFKTKLSKVAAVN